MLLSTRELTRCMRDQIEVYRWKNSLTPMHADQTTASNSTEL